MQFLGVCEICRREVNALEVAAYPVTGWEFSRTGGGQNHVVGRQREPDRIAHAQCVKRQLDRGDQMSLGA